MTKQKRKKPTVKELTAVISNLIQDIESIKNRVAGVEVVLTEYISWKKDEPEYKKYFEKLIEDRTRGSVRDYKQQKVSTGKWCYRMRDSVTKRKNSNKKKESKNNENTWSIIKSSF